MQQLEHALGLLAEHGEPIPVDVLVGRLEAQLARDSSAPGTADVDPGDVSGDPAVRNGLSPRQRPRSWGGPLIAAGTAAAILVIVSLSLLLGNGAGDVIIQPAPTTTMPAPIAAVWSFLGTVDDWLTEPVMLDGEYYATHKGLDDDAQPNQDGLVEGHIERVGELWTSLDGVTWMPAVGGEQPPPVSPEAPIEGAAVVVRRNPLGDLYGQLVAEGLWATSDGTSWREIALRPSQDNWIPWVETGGLGWVVYSPPAEATVEADTSRYFQGPRHGNLGLWYTPDTEAWFEVTDLGPLADAIHSVGEVGVIDTAMIVRDTDILVYVHIAKNIGFGFMGDPHTDIWRLDLFLGAQSQRTIWCGLPIAPCYWTSATDPQND